MLRALGLKACLGWAIVAEVAGCSGAVLREQAGLLDMKIAGARERGAYRCAAPELARAETHAEFLRYELDQGDFLRAQEHYEVAVDAVDRAIANTDPNQCATKRVLIMEQADRDGDEILDDVDQCPDEPEDKDGFEDENGCPDPDNDGDTVLDVDDRCPREAGDPKDQGCPLADRDADGVADERDKCPDIPEDLDGTEDEDGCPEEESQDSDGDGVLDNVDKCPQEPEDLDQFEDENGCPDPDNDADTVLDIVDGCPIQPGPPSNNGCPLLDRDGDGVTDDVDRCPDVPGNRTSGCPRRVLVVKTENKIEIKKQIRFATNKALIKGRVSFTILDQVAAVLESNPLIKVVIEGHTDSVGAADYNLKLSDDRARAVLEALVERGIDSGRLESIGYGESKPISSNKTRRGRAANRRVEFNIVQEGGEP